METELNIQAIGEKAKLLADDIKVLMAAGEKTLSDGKSLLDEFRSKSSPAPTPTPEPKLVTESAPLSVRAAEMADDLAELQASGVAQANDLEGIFKIKSLIGAFQSLAQAAAVLEKLLEGLNSLIAK